MSNTDGIFSATINTILPIIGLDEFSASLGTAKADEKLPRKNMYYNVVIVGRNNNWLFSQWLSTNVIIESVRPSLTIGVQSVAKGRATARPGCTSRGSASPLDRSRRSSTP